MKKLNKKSFLSPVVILLFLVGVIISISLYYSTSSNIENTNNQEFEHLLKRKTNALQKELDTNLQVLQSIKSFYNSSTFVDRNEFREFVSIPLQKYKSIQALEWIPVVTKEERQKYEQMAKKDLGVAFNITKKTSNGQMLISEQKDIYFPVYYLEPLKGNEKVLGFDVGSNEIRLKSLLEAKEKRRSTASGRITLIQRKEKQFGFLVFEPIWDIKDENKLKGFALGVYRIADMIKASLNENRIESSLLTIWLADTTNANKSELLYTNSSIQEINKTKDFMNIKLNGRTWTLFAKPSKEFIEKNSTSMPLLILLGSLFITILITYIVASKVNQTKELEELVEEKTKTLKGSNKKYQALLDMFDKKVIASRTDLRGIITYSTQAFANISGYEKEELLGSNHNILRHDDMPKELYINLWKTIQAGQTFTAEIKNKRKDGTFYWVRAVIMPEFDEKGNIVSYFAVRDDITAKKEVEQLNKTLEEKVDNAVKENQKKDQLLLEQSKLAAMGEMIGAIAHQWRQPLNTLAIKIQFIEDDFEDELIDEEYLKEFSSENMKLINFMSKTIDDFRNFFTIDKVKKSFDIHTKIDETTNMLEAQLKSHKIELRKAGDSFRTLGFASEFQQVILNIVNNAKDELIQKEINDGMISINISRDENFGYVIIEDNAGGISEDIIARIFEPYFTTKEQGKGTGLGLYMSKMIIEENMNGEIKVENTDIGAKFTIKLEVRDD